VKVRKPLEASAIGKGDSSLQFDVAPPASGYVAPITLSTTDGGFWATTDYAYANPTLVARDATLGQQLMIIPNEGGGAYNPLSKNGNQQIVAWGDAGINTQVLEISPHCSQNVGVRLQSTGTPYALIGAGGTNVDPAVRIEMNRTANTITAISPSGMTLTSNLGATATPSLALLDNISGNQIKMYPNAVDNIQNTLVQAGDVAIIGSTLTGGLTLTNDSTTTNGIRITDTAVTMGAGGTSDTPTTSFAINTPSGQITSVSNVLQMVYTTLQLQTGALPNTAGAPTGLYLPVVVNGVTYKIALLAFA
jgi:hypothetical protein